MEGLVDLCEEEKLPCRVSTCVVERISISCAPQGGWRLLFLDVMQPSLEAGVVENCIWVSSCVHIASSRKSPH